MNKNSVLIGILAIANIGLSSCNNELDKLENNERKTAIASRAIARPITEKIDFLYKGNVHSIKALRKRRMPYNLFCQEGPLIHPMHNMSQICFYMMIKNYEDRKREFDLAE